MKTNSYKIIFVTLAFLLAGCVCNSPHVDPNAKPIGYRVNVDDALDQLDELTNISTYAQELIRQALLQTVYAEKQAIEAKELVEKMKKQGSPHSGEVEELRKNYKTNTDILQRKLNEVQDTLTKQQQQFVKLNVELETARKASELSENEKKILEAQNLELNKLLKDSQKYKEKYEKLTKYKWIVWGIAGWLIIKFMGSLGAWSPQGRIGKMLIG